MKKRGVFRLSVALAVAVLAGGGYTAAFGATALWKELDDVRIYMCVNAPDSSLQELKKCSNQQSGNWASARTKHLTREAYWAEALGFALLMDFALAAFFLGITWVSRWVADGFTADPESFGRTPKPQAKARERISPRFDQKEGCGSVGALLCAEIQPRATSREVAALVLSGSPERK